jgi:hypothetical protein
MGIRRKKTFMEQAVDYVEHAVEQVRPHVEQAVDTAKERAVPAIVDVKDKAVATAGPVITDARDRARPVIADGAALAADKAALVAEVASAKAAEGRDLAAAKVAEIKGEEPKKKHRLRKVVLFTGLAAGAAFVASKIKASQDSKNWQSSYTPTPPPAPAPAPAAPSTADDAAGSSPDEALSDEAESAHPVTTPDEPVEETVVEGDEKA